MKTIFSKENVSMEQVDKCSNFAKQKPFEAGVLFPVAYSVPLQMASNTLQ